MLYDGLDLFSLFHRHLLVYFCQVECNIWKIHDMAAIATRWISCIAVTMMLPLCETVALQQQWGHVVRVSSLSCTASLMFYLKAFLIVFDDECCTSEFIYISNPMCGLCLPCNSIGSDRMRLLGCSCTAERQSNKWTWQRKMKRGCSGHLDSFCLFSFSVIV